MESSDTFFVGNTPVYVTKVTFFGLGKTSPEFLKKQLGPLVKSKNLSELLQNSSELRSMLQGLQIFKECTVTIDTEKGSFRNDAYKVNVHVEEKRPQTIKGNWSVNTDGSMRMGGYYSLNNIFKKGERFEIEGNLGSDATKTRSATFIKPFEMNPNAKLLFGGSDCNYDHWWSKFMRNESSIFAELMAPTRLGLHKLHWSNVWREIEASSPSTPYNIRIESGSTLKTNISHSVEIDSRDDRVFPQSGCLLRFSEELSFLRPPPLASSSDHGNATLPEDERSTQLRLDGIFQKPLRLNNWLVAEGTLSAGLVHSLSAHPISIADRFFLGGPMELRGYRFCSVGPAEPQMLPLLPSHTAGPSETGVSGDAPSCPTGALASCIAGLHIYAPLPFVNSITEDGYTSFARLHAFALTGCLFSDPIREWRSARDSGDSFSSRCQAVAASVVGGGVALRFAGAVRLEINYCFPLAGSILFSGAASPQNLPKAGFQLGFGVNYT
nr:sorting and assembly machinery component 50 [Hymenolepis microstoma]